MGWYRTGTITLVAGSDVVLGAGTAWVRNALPGDILSVPGAVLEVKRIVSDGELQLATAYTGAGGAGLSYALVPTQGYVPEALQAMQQILGEFGDIWQAWQAGDLQGRGLVLKGSVDAVEDLPADGNTAGDGYIVAGSKLYVWNGAAWAYAGEMVATPELLALRQDARDARDEAVGFAGAAGVQAGVAASKAAEAAASLVAALAAGKLFDSANAAATSISPVIAIGDTAWLRPNAADGLKRITAAKRINGGTTIAAFQIDQSFATGAEFDLALPVVQALAKYVPLVYDDAQKVPLWLDNGLLDAVGVGAQLRSFLQANLDFGTRQISPAPSLVPLAVDDAGKVALWLNGGRLEAMGVGAQLLAFLQANLDYGARQVTASASLVPLAVDDSGKVPAWLSNGLLDAKGFGPGLSALMTAAVSAAVAALKFAPLAGPAASPRPINTDGRSLYAWRAKTAKVLRGAAVQAKVLITGDSWTEMPAIPQQLANLLYAQYGGKSGEGWVSVMKGNPINGVNVVSSGWTLYDASTGAVPSAALGCGLDGGGISAIGEGATYSVTVLMTKLVIYYWDTAGTFRYRIDGGAWVSVTGTGTNTLARIVVNGLSDAAHTLQIDTIGNTTGAAASLAGLYTSRPSVGGVELSKAGNGGINGVQLSNFASYIAGPASDILPDVVIVCLGTNDYRQSSLPDQYIAALTALVAAYRSVSPNTAFIFVAPADTNGVAQRPLTLYRDALYAWCIQAGHEFYNMNEDWPSFAVANAMGQFADNLHVTDDGAFTVVRRLHSRFLA